jgi:hypothetical protein
VYDYDSKDFSVSLKSIVTVTEIESADSWAVSAEEDGVRIDTPHQGTITIPLSIVWALCDAILKTRSEVTGR